MTRTSVRILNRTVMPLVLGGVVTQITGVCMLLWHLATWDDPSRWLAIAAMTALGGLLPMILGIFIDLTGIDKGWWPGKGVKE